MGYLARAVVLAFLVIGVSAGPASALTFTVNSTADANDVTPGDGLCAAPSPAAPAPCTLRAAVQEANATPAVADTVTVPAGTFNLTQPVPISGPDDAGGDLDILGPLTINGAGARSTIIDQQVPDRVVQASSAGVFLRGLTITGGAPGSNQGAGILNQGDLTVENSTVRGNSGAGNGGGISNDFSSTLVVDHSLVSGNVARGALGGGIYSRGFNAQGPSAQIINSTLSGNTADDGSAIATQGQDGTAVTAIQYSTITANNSATAPGAAVANIISGSSAATQVRDSIVAANAGTGTDCSGVVSSAGYNIESGISCSFKATGDKQNTDPLLGSLADNGGPTDTHLPAATSPAIDTGNPTGCPATDQRGVLRPVGPFCDIGAVEVQPAQQQQQQPGQQPRPAALTLDPVAAKRLPGDVNVVTATVRNDDGSPGAGRTVRYAISGPNAGAGLATTDASGVARISWDGVHEGTDTLDAYVDTNGDAMPGADEPSARATVRWALPKPVQGRTANIDPVSGVVRIRVPGGSAKGRAGAAASLSSLLTEARQVPLATVVDTRRGRVRMTTASGRGRGTQTGQFYAGVYTTSQPRSGTRPITELRLTESLSCRARRSGKVSASRARSRRLWGNARGRFRTRGRHSAATVRGTIWLQKDTCTTTTTVVRRGTVDVRDLVKRKNVRVKAGGRYVARARRR